MGMYSFGKCVGINHRGKIMEIISNAFSTVFLEIKSYQYSVKNAHSCCFPSIMDRATLLITFTQLYILGSCSPNFLCIQIKMVFMPQNGMYSIYCIISREKLF